jgi:hypothetical protein
MLSNLLVGFLQMMKSKVGGMKKNEFGVER